MGLPDRALHRSCWAQNNLVFFRDDWILSSTIEIEILARSHKWKVPSTWQSLLYWQVGFFWRQYSGGFIKGGTSNLAWNGSYSCMVLKNGKRMLDPNVYTMLILELGKNPDKQMHVSTLLDELVERERDLNMSQQNCKTIMKACKRIGKFDI